MSMPYSEMFADPARRRARVFERLAEKQQRIRTIYSEMLEDLTELRDEPDKIVARELVEALRIDPHQASTMLRGSTATTEVLTPTGHTTPAPLPLVRDAAREGAVSGEHIDEITKTMAQLPTGSRCRSGSPWKPP